MSLADLDGFKLFPKGFLTPEKVDHPEMGQPVTVFEVSPDIIDLTHSPAGSPMKADSPESSRRLFQN